MDIELQTPEIIKLFGSRKKLIETKNGENVLSFKVVEVVLIQCNLVDNQYQHKSEILKLVSAIFYQFFIFLPNDRPSKTMKNLSFNEEQLATSSRPLLFLITSIKKEWVQKKNKVNFLKAFS